MKSLPILVLVIGLTSCQSQEEKGSTSELSMMEVNLDKLEDLPSSPEEPLPVTPPAEPAKPTQTVSANKTIKPKPFERQIIRNANVSFQVEEINQSSKKLETIVNQLGGFIASTRETRDIYQLKYNLTARIPASKLDTFLIELLKESIYTENKTITAEDVTKRYIDLEARIKAKKVTEEKYLELLKKARTVDEVLKVEGQLARIREDRESKEAEFRELKNDVAMSTVYASLSQKLEGTEVPSSPFYVKIWDSFTEGFSLLSSAFLAFFYVIPILTAFSLIVWIFRRWWGNRKKEV